MEMTVSQANIQRVTRVEVKRANIWKDNEPVYALKFMWDNEVSRSGEAKYNLYVWNVKYKNPMVVKGENGEALAFELDIEDVVARCAEIGIVRNNGIEIAEGEVVTSWSKELSKEDKDRFDSKVGSKLKVGTDSNGKKRRGITKVNIEGIFDEGAKKEVETVKEEVYQPVAETKVEVKVVTKSTKQDKVEVEYDMLLDMDKLRAEVEAELAIELDAETNEKAEMELREELMAEVTAEVIEEVKAKLKADMEEEIREKLIREKKESNRELVRETLKKEIKASLSGGSEIKEVEVGADGVNAETKEVKSIYMTDNEIIKTSQTIEYRVEEEYEDNYDEVPVVENSNIPDVEEKIVVSKKKVVVEEKGVKEEALVNNESVKEKRTSSKTGKRGRGIQKVKKVSVDFNEPEKEIDVNSFGNSFVWVD